MGYILDAIFLPTGAISELFVVLYIWQQLIGSLIGAAVPVSLFLLARWIFEQKDYLDNMERATVVGINNLIEIDYAINKFSTEKLGKTIKELESTLEKDAYFIGRIFFPLMYVFEFPKDLVFNHSTGSNYLENLVLQVYSKSQDMPAIVNDMRKQLETTLEDHRTLCISGKGTYLAINTGHLENLRGYKVTFDEEWFTKILPVILWSFVSARVAVREFRALGGLWGWRRKFDPIDFKFFLNKKSFEEFRQKGKDRAEAYLKEKIEREYESIYKNQFTRYISNWTQLVYPPKLTKTDI